VRSAERRALQKIECDLKGSLSVVAMTAADDDGLFPTGAS
jgi:hypothetical protein